ncbi:hypothetical protein [Roseobacter sp.]|uniref:hypothetical protein n=1 Tax=Roseobacter sp. TaxID=1907202 RepID=UPI0032996158
MDGTNALALYQQTLDVMSHALMNGDQATSLAYTKLPHLRRTLRSKVVVETAEDLATGRDIFLKALKGLGATNLVRLATDAEFLSDNYIAGHHVTHWLRDAVPVVESYANRMVLLREDGIWKLQELESSLDNPHWPIHIPRVLRDGVRFDRLTAPESDARMQAVDPLSIYQSFINNLSVANMNDDFDTYCSYMLFPHSAHTEFADTTISTRADVRPFFDMMREQRINLHQGRLVRQAESAEFISGDLICGYHTTAFLTGDTVIRGPIKSRMMLKREGTAWYMKSVTNSLANTRFPCTVPKPSDALVTLRTIQERTRHDRVYNHH